MLFEKYRIKKYLTLNKFLEKPIKSASLFSIDQNRNIESFLDWSGTYYFSEDALYYLNKIGNYSAINCN